MASTESLIELAKHASSRHDERRKYEWKFSLAFWGLIITAISEKNNIAVLQNLQPRVGWVIGLAFAFMWLRGLWVANDNDKRLSKYFIDTALKSENQHDKLTLPEKHRFWSWPSWFGFLKDWSLQFQLFVTITLLLLFYLK